MRIYSVGCANFFPLYIATMTFNRSLKMLIIFKIIVLRFMESSYNKYAVLLSYFTGWLKRDFSSFDTYSVRDFRKTAVQKNSCHL